METVEVVVIGAGAVGLAVAQALACDGRETLVLEAQDSIGSETSSRNSEVIHAGIYYPPGSLKAELCVRGRDLLYEFCVRNDVPHRACGKLIVATREEQIPVLKTISTTARANGVDLEYLDQKRAQSLEPALRCVAALHSSRTGILDSHSYMLALQGVAEQYGASVLCRSRVTAMRLENGAVSISIDDGEPVIRARLLVNCAGIHASRTARSIDGFPAAAIPREYFAKGSYFTLAGPSPFSRLIYPVPEAAGLGVHLTLDMAGRARFGPDVQWIEQIDYGVDPRRSEGFYDAIRMYWPAISPGGLSPGYAGIRPKIYGPAQPSADFRIDGPAEHGVRCVVNLFGIESPGLTASLAIGSRVTGIVRAALA